MKAPGDDEEERGMKPGFRICAVAGFWLAAFLLLGLPAQADEIEPEPEPEPALEPEPQPEPKAAPKAVPAPAPEAAEYDRTGPYLMAGGGYSIENFGDVGPVSVDDSPNLVVHAGWRFHSHVAADVGFEWNSGFDASFAGGDAELETYFVTVGMKLYALKGRIQPFLHPSVGVMIAKLDVDAADVSELGSGFSDDTTTPGLRLGGGIDTYITENLFVSFSAYYVFPLDSLVDDLQYTSVSGAVGWRF
jgi:opacity protein-like surface antigen